MNYNPFYSDADPFKPRAKSTVVQCISTAMRRILLPNRMAHNDETWSQVAREWRKGMGRGRWKGMTGRERWPCGGQRRIQTPEGQQGRSVAVLKYDRRRWPRVIGGSPLAPKQWWATNSPRAALR